MRLHRNRQENPRSEEIRELVLKPDTDTIIWLKIDDYIDILPLLIQLHDLTGLPSRTLTNTIETTELIMGIRQLGGDYKDQDNLPELS